MAYGAGGKFLQGGHGRVATHIVAAHADGQPVGVAGKDAAKVEGGDEQAVGHAHGGVRDGAANLTAAAGCVRVQGELEIEKTVGRDVIGIQTALIGERRALGLRGGECQAQSAKCQQGREKGLFCFHNGSVLWLTRT